MTAIAADSERACNMLTRVPPISELDRRLGFVDQDGRVTGG